MYGSLQKSIDTFALMKFYLVIILSLAVYSIDAQSAFAKADTVQQSRKKIEVSRNKAEHLYQDKEYQKALAQFQKLHVKQPKDTLILERLGDCHAYLNEFATAADWYEKLVENNKNSANYQFKLGAALAMQAKNASRFKALMLLSDIKNHLKQAAQLNPEHIEVRYALVQLYCELPGILGGSYVKSEKYADELLNISEIDGLFAYAAIYEHEEELEAAEKSLKKALEIGNSITAFTKLGSLQEKKMKDFKAAYQTYLKASSQFPKHQPFQNALKRIETRLVAVGTQL